MNFVLIYGVMCVLTDSERDFAVSKGFKEYTKAEAAAWFKEQDIPWMGQENQTVDNAL